MSWFNLDWALTTGFSAAHGSLLREIAAQRRLPNAQEIVDETRAARGSSAPVAPREPLFAWRCDYCGRRAYTAPLSCVSCGAPA